MKREMKKVFCILACAVVTFSVTAQTVNDALNLSDNNYYGTARTVGLGNAVTAIGGDLGTVGINPAGSAVAGYSQVSITPALSFSVTDASFAPSSQSSAAAFGPDSKSVMTRFTLPNIGMMLRFETGRSYGVRAVSFGIVSNSTNNYAADMNAGGNNSLTSITGAFAAQAMANADGFGRRMPSDILHYSSPFSSDYNWNCIAAYWGGMINCNMDSVGQDYFGSAETVLWNEQEGRYDYFVKGELRQRYNAQSIGTKNDVVFNLGFDINDNVFVGVNLGVPAANYRYNQTFRENVASDPMDFVVTPEYIGSDGKYVKGPTTTFDEAVYQHSLSQNVTGIYGKFGIIALPNDNLRLGAAVRTPTVYNVRETWQVQTDSYFVGFDGKSSHENSYSPVGEYQYQLVGPYSINAGLAYTFGSAALLSVDYEMTDFSVMKYRTRYSSGNDDFARVNRLNNLFCGVSHSVRAGFEIKPLPFIALRAGFSLKTDPSCYYLDDAGEKVDAYIYDEFYDDFESGRYILSSGRKFNSDNVWAVSAGLGFISAGSFFADFAVRRTAFATTYTYPYAAYIDAPVIRARRSLWDALLTFGWRF